MYRLSARLWLPLVLLSFLFLPQPDLAAAERTGAAGDKPALRASASAATFVVDATGDEADADVADGQCSTGGDDPVCTLRAAIQQANASPGADTIAFNVSGDAPHTIALQVELPVISDPVTIDGSTQPGYEDTPVVVIDGGQIGLSAQGLAISAGASTVRALEIRGFSGDGIVLHTNGRNTIIGNVIAGSSSLACESDGSNVLDAASEPIVLEGFGGDQATATGVNNCGETVGWAETTLGANQEHAFLWLPEAAYGLPQGMNDLHPFLGTDWSVATAINDQGQIVGYHCCVDGEIHGFETHAFLWDQGEVTDIGPLPHEMSYNIWAMDINEAGQITGHGHCREEQNDDCTNVFIWEDGTLTELGTLEACVIERFDGSESLRRINEAISINSHGDVLGTSTKPVGDFCHTRYPVLWREGAIIDLPAEIGLDSTPMVAAQNDQGVMVGRDGLGFFVWDGETLERISTDRVFDPTGVNNRETVIGNIDAGLLNDTHVGLWQDGELTDLGTLVDEENSRATALSDRGHVVGWAGQSNNFHVPALWPPNAGRSGPSSSSSRSANVASTSNGSGISILDSADNTVGGTESDDGNVIIDRDGSGIHILGDDSTANRILGNHIGVAADGATARGNGQSGILVDAPGNTIGGTEPGAGNLISDNAEAGIQVGSGITDTLILGNLIGIAASGVDSLPNGGDGIAVHGSNTQIGGGETGAGNVIAGNGGHGIYLAGDSAATRIQGNLIGTDGNGTAALANAGEGILVDNSANNIIGGSEGTSVGGPCTGACNLVSGHDGNGIHLQGDGAFSNTILGNYIGTDYTGTVALGNHNGVLVDEAPANQVGGRTVEEANLIVGNRSYGISVSGAGATGNTVIGNLIGPDASTADLLGNDLGGVHIDQAPDNSIGETEGEAGNIIAGNGGSGIVVEGDEATGNSLRGNEIYLNAELGIDLAGDGPTINDADDADEGPNRLMNYPLVLDVAYDEGAGETTIRGELVTDDPTAAVVDVYASEERNRGGAGPAQTYLGSAQPAGDGTWQLTFNGQVPSAFPVVNATATGAGGSTSEFNQSVPLVFVPGIAGSRLVVDPPDDDAFELWPGGIRSHDPLSLYPGEGPSAGDIYTPDVIRTLEVRGFTVTTIYRELLTALVQQGGYTEYQVDGRPERRTEEGCDVENQRHASPTLFVFSYDWRKSNVESAAALAEYVRCVQKFYPGTQVNVLTHSMGGLVARRYLLDNPDDHHVNKLITMAAPFLGAPKMLYVLETGDFGVPNVWNSTLKRLIGSFTGAHELLPSRLYHLLGGAPILVEDGWDWNENGDAQESLSYADVIAGVNQRYGRDVFDAGTAAETFHDYTTGHGGQDDWRADQRGVRVHHIYGRQSTNKTISRVDAIIRQRCRPVGASLMCRTATDFRRHMGAGDVTVPVLSAERVGNGQDLNAPDARLYPFCGEGGNDDLVEHLGISKNPQVHDLVMELLENNATPVFTSNCPGSSGDARAAGIAAEGTLNTHLTILGADDVVVADSAGHSSEVITGSIYGEVPGVDLYFGETGVAGAVLSASETYSITFQTSDEPLLLEWTRGSGEDVAEAVRYQDLVLPEGRAAALSLGPDSFVLRYDEDGDGIPDTEVDPTAVQTGPDLDLDPPQIQSTRTARGAVVQVELTASDEESGLKALYYSLDGVEYQPYRRTLTVKPDVTPVIYAFAEDNASNRAGLEVPVASATEEPAESVTGGGWIQSPEGAYEADPSLTGQAEFGFNAKHDAGASVPTGETQFQFNAGDLTFHASSYEVLDVAGTKATYQGQGTLNGSGNYSFMLSAIDGDLDTSDAHSADKFRIRIWDSTGTEGEDDDQIIYDNQVACEDMALDADPCTAIGGGSITIHGGNQGAASKATEPTSGDSSLYLPVVSTD